MKNIKTIGLCAIIIVSTMNYGIPWPEPAGKVTATIISNCADKNVALLVGAAGSLGDKGLVVAGSIDGASTALSGALNGATKTFGVSADKLALIGNGALIIAAAGVTIYGAKEVCHAGQSIKSSCFPSQAERKVRLEQELLCTNNITALQAKKSFEQCIDNHYKNVQGFPEACRNEALAYAKLGYTQEVDKIINFFNEH